MKNYTLVRHACLSCDDLRTNNGFSCNNGSFKKCLIYKRSLKEGKKQYKKFEAMRKTTSKLIFDA